MDWVGMSPGEGGGERVEDQPSNTKEGERTEEFTSGLGKGGLGVWYSRGVILRYSPVPIVDCWCNGFPIDISGTSNISRGDDRQHLMYRDAPLFLREGRRQCWGVVNSGGVIYISLLVSLV